MKNIFLKSKAKSLQKTGGGDSQKNVHHLGVASEMPPRCLRDASVSIYSCQSDFSSRVWKYAAMLLMVFVVGIGNVWGQTFRYYIAISNEDATAASGAVRVFKTSDDEHFTNVTSQFTLNSEYSTSSAGSVYYTTSKTYVTSSGDGCIMRSPRYTKNKTFTINWTNTNLSFSKITFQGVGTNSGTKNITIKNSSTDAGDVVQFPKSSNLGTYEKTKEFTQANGITLVSANDQPAYAITILHAVDHAEITSTETEMVTSESLQMEAWPLGGTWSIVAGGTGTGSITSAGVLTASANGTIKVKYAKDGYGEDIKTITVSDSRTIHWFAAGNTDAATNEVSNNTSFFSFNTTSTSDQSGNITIGSKTYSLTKRLNAEQTTWSFTVPSNTTGTLNVVAISSGGSDRTLTMQKAGESGTIELGSTTNQKTAWSLITKVDIPAGTYTVSSNGNVRFGMMLMIINKTEPAVVGAYTVTAATSTGDNTLGTVSAGASSLDATETTTITASPATGYRVTNWAVSGTDANISPSGASNSNTTTLTMGTADATVTVTFGPKPYTITLDNQSATEAGTENVTATYNASTNLTSAITCPTKTDKVFAGYFTAANGGGVQLIDAAGNWIASAGGGSTYLDGSKNWKKDADVTLYACWMEYCPGMDMAAQAISLGSGEHKTWTGLTTNKILYSVAGNTTFDDSSDASDAYDGLKFKNSGDYLLFLVQANSSLKLYFGYTDTKPKISINGGAESDINVASTKSKTPNQEVDFGTETYDRLVKVRTVTSNAVVLQKIEITAPESSDCSAFEFHYGPEIGEWETACFTQVGETNEWRIEDFTVPSTGNYYVGYHGDGVNGWNSTWSATKSWTDSYSDGNGAMVLLPGTSAVGQATGAQGTLIIWSNSGDKNKYVGFKPNGYGIMYGGSSYAFAASGTEHALETEVVTLPDVSTTYTMGLATATPESYVACAHSAAAEALSNMGVSNVGNGKKKIYLVPGSFDAIDAEEKFAVFDKTADKFDTDFMTDLDGDGVYEGYVSSDCASIILVRMSSEATTEELANKDWTHKWNQTTGDGIAISGTLAKKYTITSLSGDNCAYTEETVHPATGQKGVFRMWDNSGSQNWYVNFVPYYTLSYDGNGASGSTAAAERCAESSTLTVTVAANGFTVPGGKLFAGWAISQEHADAGTVDYAAGDDYTLTSDATLYAVWESNCPTTGTLFTLSNVGSGYSNNSDAETELTNITLSGGTAYGFGTSDRALEYKSNKIKYNGNANYIKLVLDCPLQVGDEISVTCDEGTGLNFNTDPSTGLGNNGSHPTYVLNGGTYEVKAEDGIIGESTIICWRRTGNGTNVTAITITRPIRYDVTYYKNDGTETSTLAEDVTKVAANEFVRSGYQFTGWNTDPAGEGTAYAVGASLSSDLTLYAQWAELYTITTGSPANGTVEADKASAVAGATITLTATPEDGYKLSAWDVYKTGDATTKVSVTNNQFTMPAYGVTISAEFVESVVLYDYSVMDNKSFTGETVDGNQTGKSKTFGSEGNPQLVVENAGWDSKSNIINSFIKFFGGTSSMSVVIPTGRKATVTIKYGSYNTGRYLLVNGTEQTHPLKALDNDITTSNIDTYMPTVELTNQTGTLVLTANGSNNIYIAYVDVTLTGNASYGVTYHLNDGAWNGDAGAATYTYGTGIATLATNVTRDYYDFAGWYGNEGLTGDAVTSIATSTTGDKEFWAAWTPKSYTLTWSWDGGACSATAGEDYTAGGSVAYGTTLVYPEASTMSKADAAFAGWSSIPATMPAEALTITAQWAPEHAISYKEVKGSDVSAYPTTYVQGVGVASFEPLADVADFHFTGWSPASIGTDATEDVDVTAQWVAAYNVAFSAGEGSGTVPATFQKWSGATVELPGQGEMVAPEGKVFDGWKVNGEGETRAAGYEYTMTAAAVEFVAQWKAVTLLINYDGENYSINTSAFTTVVESLDGTHYTVNGVEYNKNFQFGNTSSGFANVAWSNKFLAYDVKTTSATMKLYVYNKNTGSQNLYYQIVSETSTGSFTTESISGQGDGEIVTIDISATKGTRVFFGVGSKDVRICQIEVTEEGTNLPAVGEVGYELAMKGRPIATGSSNLFTGSIDGIEYNLYSELRPINGNAYSVMRANDGTNYFKFTTSTNTQLQVTTGNNIKFYVLNNATTGDPDSDTQYGGSAATHNINLLASSNPYYIVPVVAGTGTSNEVRVTKIAFAAAPDALTVTYKDGEDTYTTQNVWSGEKTTAPAAPTKSGYRFLGWLDGEDNTFDFANTTISADLELHASWQKTWTVTFNADNGSDPAEVTVDNNTAVAAPDPAPEKAGNDFAGWYYGEPAAEYNFATLVTADLTLTAHWTPLDDDASISALAYNGNAIELAEGEEIAGVMTFHVLLPWGETPDKDLISVTKSAESATVGTISYESESKTASFTVTAGDHTTTADYAIVFANDVKKGASIIKATTNNVVTGLIGGSIDQSYSGSAGSRKLNKNEYFGIQLAEGNFQEGDVLIINITTPADLGNFMVYADAARTELLADQGITYTKPDAASPVVCPTGEMRLVLPAAVDGHNALYLSRENGNTQWNVTFSSLEVTREINPIIKSFKFGESAAAIDEEHKTISIDVPYGTDVTALTPTIEAYGNFGATYTPEGAQDFTSPVDYTITDGYSEFNTTYAVTVNVAAPSENAYLASLSVEGYALDFSKEVEEYDIVLDYGTTVLPTITYAVEDAGLAEAVKVEGGVNGATTITVTPQAGAGYEKVYTINFSVSTMPKFVIYDGSTMDAIAESGSDGESGFAWTIKAASKTNGESGAKSFDDKNYAKYVNVFTSATKAPSAGDARYMTITIPNGYLAKFRLVGSGNGDGSRSLFISKEITSTVDESIAYATTTSSNVLDGRTSDFQFPGTYYLCSNNSIRLYELSVTLYPINHSREVGEGLYGTICLPNGGIMVGATIYEVAHMTYENAQPYKLFFDEVLDGVMEAGMPYIFMPKEGVSSIAVTYTDEANAPAGSYNGLHGTLDNMNGTQLLGKYIFYNNMLFMSENEANWLNANRAYIQLNEVPDYVTPVAPNRRRVSMGFNGTNSATGIESISDEGLEMKGAQKMLINGKIYILRGEKMYDATGRLVK